MSYVPGRYSSPPVGPHSKTSSKTTHSSAYVAMMEAESSEKMEGIPEDSVEIKRRETAELARQLLEEDEERESEDLFEIKRRETAELARQLLEEDDGTDWNTTTTYTTGEANHPNSEWVAYVDESSGSTYYYNTVDGETTWEEPFKYHFGNNEDTYAVIGSDPKANWAKLRGMVMGRPGAPSRNSTYSSLKRKSSAKSLQHMGLLDGLGVDFLDTPWISPKKNTAEAFKRLNTFQDGKASVCEMPIEDFGEVSVGVRAMFQLYQYLGIVMLISVLLSIPALLVYTNGTGSENVFDLTTLSSWSVASSGLTGNAIDQATSESKDVSKIQVNFGPGNKITAAGASEMISAIDFVTSVFMFISFFVIRHKLAGISNTVKHHNISAASFTIMVGQGLPTKVTRKELADHFSSLYSLDTIDFRLRKPQYEENARSAVRNVAKQERYDTNSRVKVLKKSKNGNIKEIEVTVPKNKHFGEHFVVDLPDGRTINCKIPKGVGPGHSFSVQCKEPKDTTSSKYSINSKNDESSSEFWDPNAPKLVTPVSDTSYHPEADIFKGSWVADVALVRNEGDVLRKYMGLAEIDAQVRLQRAKVKRVSPTTTYSFGEDPAAAKTLTCKLQNLEYELQQGLLAANDNKDESDYDVVKAFVTFKHEESFRRAVSDYKDAWRRRGMPCCGQSTHLHFKGKLLHVVEAPEAGDVFYENQGEYKKPICHDFRYFFSIGIVFGILLLSLSTIIIVYIVKDNITPNRDTEAMCSVNIPQALSTTPVSASISGAQYTRTKTKDDTCKSLLDNKDAIFLMINDGKDFTDLKYNLSFCTPKVHSCTVIEKSNQLCPCLIPNSKDICKLDKAITSQDISICFCIQKINRYKDIYGLETALQKIDKVVCDDWLKNEGLSSLLSFLASTIIAVVNIFLGFVVAHVATYARHASISELNAEIFVVMTLSQLFNSIALNVIVNAVPIGHHADFSRSWFASAGTAMVSTMWVLCITTNINPIRIYKKFVKESKSAFNQPENYVSQHALNSKLVGTSFDLPHRMTFVLIPVVASIIFGTFMPLLYPISILTIVLTFWVDKFLILRYHRRPESMSAAIPIFAVDILIVCVLIRIALSCWIFGIESLFVSKNKSNDFVASAAGGIDRLTKSTSLPHFILLLVLGGGVTFYEFWIMTLGALINILINLCSQTKASVAGSSSIVEPQNTRNQVFSEMYSQIVPPMKIVSTNQKIRHQLLSLEESQRGWVHVCKSTMFLVPCVDPKCKEWHEKRKMWLMDSTVQGVMRKKGEFLKTWEVIRENNLFNYHIGYNPHYKHVLHLRNEELLIQKGDKGKKQMLERINSRNLERMKKKERKKSLQEDVEKIKKKLTKTELQVELVQLG
jgi:hypothetical protein